jgi:hypothetical protein
MPSSSSSRRCIAAACARVNLKLRMRRGSSSSSCKLPQSTSALSSPSCLLHSIQAAACRRHHRAVAASPLPARV